jgi:hypothetical protein
MVEVNTVVNQDGDHGRIIVQDGLQQSAISVCRIKRPGSAAAGAAFGTVVYRFLAVRTDGR